MCVDERFVNNVNNVYFFSKVQHFSGKVLKLLPVHVQLLSFVGGTEEPGEHFRCKSFATFSYINEICTPNRAI